MSQELESMNQGWTKEKVEKTLKEILMEALGVEEATIVPEASLVHDLGAESIDFLDIGFRIQQTFGVELPSRAIQEKALSWRNLSALGRILAERYEVHIGPEEMRQFHTMGILQVLQWLSEKRGMAVRDGEAKKIAVELVDRLAHEIESLGFKASLIDREGIVQLLLQNLNSPKIMEGMLRLFSVEALVDFITAQVCEKG